MPRTITVFLLSSFIHYVASSALPGASLQTVNTTESLAGLGTCTGFKLFRPRPLYGDCSEAINRLSDSSLHGNFHARGDFDDFQLPLAEEVETCIVKVETRQSSLGESSSWHEIKTAAKNLKDQCRVKQIFDVTGGVVRVGQHQWIQISLARTLMSDKEAAADG